MSKFQETMRRHTGPVDAKPEWFVRALEPDRLNEGAGVDEVRRDTSCAAGEALDVEV